MLRNLSEDAVCIISFKEEEFRGFNGIMTTTKVFRCICISKGMEIHRLHKSFHA